jgi:uncharacterized protein with HEPN domain
MRSEWRARRAQVALRDILHHIELAFERIDDFDEARFASDLRTQYAVIRCFEIISEASRRLPDEMKARHGSIPWRDIAAAGNVYRHEYEDVSHALVSETVQAALAPLRTATLIEVGCS